jgi:hypothetical protein
LQPKKIALRKTEESAEAQIGVGGNAAGAGNDRVNPGLNAAAVIGLLAAIRWR